MQFFLGFVSGVAAETIALATLAVAAWVYVRALFRRHGG